MKRIYKITAASALVAVPVGATLGVIYGTQDPKFDYQAKPPVTYGEKFFDENIKDATSSFAASHLLNPSGLESYNLTWLVRLDKDMDSKHAQNFIEYSKNRQPLSVIRVKLDGALNEKALNDAFKSANAQLGGAVQSWQNAHPTEKYQLGVYLGKDLRTREVTASLYKVHGISEQKKTFIKSYWHDFGDIAATGRFIPKDPNHFIQLFGSQCALNPDQMKYFQFSGPGGADIPADIATLKTKWGYEYGDTTRPEAWNKANPDGLQIDDSGANEKHELVKKVAEQNIMQTYEPILDLKNHKLILILRAWEMGEGSKARFLNGDQAYNPYGVFTKMLEFDLNKLGSNAALKNQTTHSKQNRDILKKFLSTDIVKYVKEPLIGPGMRLLGTAIPSLKIFADNFIKLGTLLGDHNKAWQKDVITDAFIDQLLDKLSANNMVDGEALMKQLDDFDSASTDPNSEYQSFWLSIDKLSRIYAYDGGQYKMYQLVSCMNTISQDILDKIDKVHPQAKYVNDNSLIDKLLGFLKNNGAVSSDFTIEKIIANPVVELVKILENMAAKQIHITYEAAKEILPIIPFDMISKNSDKWAHALDVLTQGNNLSNLLKILGGTESEIIKSVKGLMDAGTRWETIGDLLGSKNPSTGAVTGRSDITAGMVRSLLEVIKATDMVPSMISGLVNNTPMMRNIWTGLLTHGGARTIFDFVKEMFDQGMNKLTEPTTPPAVATILGKYSTKFVLSAANKGIIKTLIDELYQQVADGNAVGASADAVTKGDNASNIINNIIATMKVADPATKGYPTDVKNPPVEPKPIDPNKAGDDARYVKEKAAYDKAKTEYDAWLAIMQPKWQAFIDYTKASLPVQHPDPWLEPDASDPAHATWVTQHDAWTKYTTASLSTRITADVLKASIDNITAEQFNDLLTGTDTRYAIIEKIQPISAADRKTIADYVLTLPFETKQFFYTYLGGWNTDDPTQEASNDAKLRQWINPDKDLSQSRMVMPDFAATYKLLPTPLTSIAADAIEAILNSIDLSSLGIDASTVQQLKETLIPKLKSGLPAILNNLWTQPPTVTGPGTLRSLLTDQTILGFAHAKAPSVLNWFVTIDQILGTIDEGVAAHFTSVASQVSGILPYILNTFFPSGFVKGDANSPAGTSIRNEDIIPLIKGIIYGFGSANEANAAINPVMNVDKDISIIGTIKSQINAIYNNAKGDGLLGIVIDGKLGLVLQKLLKQGLISLTLQDYKDLFNELHTNLHKGLVGFAANSFPDIVKKIDGFIASHDVDQMAEAFFAVLHNPIKDATPANLDMVIDFIKALNVLPAKYQLQHIGRPIHNALQDGFVAITPIEWKDILSSFGISNTIIEIVQKLSWGTNYKVSAINHLDTAYPANYAPPAEEALQTGATPLPSELPTYSTLVTRFDSARDAMRSYLVDAGKDHTLEEIYAKHTALMQVIDDINMHNRLIRESNQKLIDTRDEFNAFKTATLETETPLRDSSRLAELGGRTYAALKTQYTTLVATDISSKSTVEIQVLIQSIKDVEKAVKLFNEDVGKLNRGEAVGISTFEQFKTWIAANHIDTPQAIAPSPVAGIAEYKPYTLYTLNEQNLADLYKQNIKIFGEVNALGSPRLTKPTARLSISTHEGLTEIPLNKLHGFALSGGKLYIAIYNDGTYLISKSKSGFSVQVPATAAPAGSGSGTSSGSHP